MLHRKMGYYYIGIDSHKLTHSAVILNCFSERLGNYTFDNVPNEFDPFIKKIEKLKPKDIEFAFGIEDTTVYGRSLTLFLVKKGFVVKHVNSSLVAHERTSLNVLHKDDDFDSECAARVLLNRFDSLPNVNPKDKFWTLSQLVTKRRLLVKSNMALKHHLQSFINHQYPNFKKYFKKIDNISTLAFLEKYPSPYKLKDASISDLTELFRKNGKVPFKNVRAQYILDEVKKDGIVTTDYQSILDEMCISNIKQLRINLTDIAKIEDDIKKFLKHFDYKLETMKGINTITAAIIIAEIGDVEKFSTPAKLAKYAGVSPVTYSSGKTKIQYANERGNRTLNEIITNLAVTVCGVSGIQNKIINCHFYDYYHKKISEGKTKKQSLKCVERRLINIIWGMLKNKTEYINPELKTVVKKPIKD